MCVCVCVCVWTADGVSNSLRFTATTKEQERYGREEGGRGREREHKGTHENQWEERSMRIGRK